MKKNIWLCGDFHRELDKFIQGVKTNDIRNSNIIILGDCEVGLRHENPRKIYSPLSRFAEQRNNTIYLVRGNHDNPAHWSTEVTKDTPIIGNKETLEKSWPNIIHLNDNSYVYLEDRLFYILGGAVSIDRSILQTNSTYFNNERLNPKSASIARSYPRDTNEQLIVLAHTGLRPPNLDDKFFNRRVAVDKRLEDDIKEEESIIRELIDVIKPDAWFNGHYHVSNTMSLTFFTLQQTLDICEFVKI